MNKSLSILVPAAFAAATFCSCAKSEGNRHDVDTFVQAKPVWAQGREKEPNLTLQFRHQFVDHLTSQACVRLAASCDYRIKLNGNFVGHGPAVAAHGFYRMDCYDLQPYIDFGTNVLTIEVASYNNDSFYLLNQPGFLQAELEVDGEIIAATGHNFEAFDLQQRVQNMGKFTFQRTQAEAYSLKPDFEAWMEKDWAGAQPVNLAEQEPKTIICRHVPYPDFRLHEADSIASGIYSFDCNSSGFLGMDIEVMEEADVRMGFDEIISGEHADGRPRIVPRRMGCHGYVTYHLAPGRYNLESFEPYTMKYVDVIVDKGQCNVERVWMRDYCGSDCQRATFECNDSATNILFEAARETFRQNAVDIFTDCPSRERAGWLCDSYFTGRSALDFAGHTRIEKNFLQNFLLPDTFAHIDKGMLPMCYPSDHVNGNYIPNWAMWFVLEMEEYLHRSGDTELVAQAKNRIYELVDFFKGYLNEDGLLEKLPRWVFVEWSEANKLVQDVNYPSNMLYARMLESVARLYDDPPLAEQAQAIKAKIIEQSFDGEFFVDNAIRQPDGKLQVTRNRTETCQYYAMALGTATQQSHPELWTRMLNEFGPVRLQNHAWPEIHPSNAFIGNYLRMEVLSQAHRTAQILDENNAYYLPMAQQTGTLWENMSNAASCNHGFASHIAHTLYRDILGVQDIDPVAKTVTLLFTPCGLSYCKGSIPMGKESINVAWTITNGQLQATVSLPAGWTYTHSAIGIEASVK